MPRLIEVYEDNIRDWFPEMLAACVGTLKLSLVAFIVAAVIGLFVALMRISPRTSPRWIAISFIEVMRGTPALVILYIVYFVPPQVGLDLADLPPSPQPSAAWRCRVAPFSPRSSGRESRPAFRTERLPWRSA